MSGIESSIIIAGPTTTGKSEIAIELARRRYGAIINSDNYYFYASPDFHIGLGLATNEPPVDIPCYLFGGRALDLPKPNPNEFFSQVILAANVADEAGHIPIVQGCSYTLNSKLIQADVGAHRFIPIWSSTQYLLERCYERTLQMLAEGLLEEARTIIAKGLDQSWIATEGIIYAPTLEFIRHGETDRAKLIAGIVKGIADKAMEQEVKYRDLQHVTWIEHDNNPYEAVDKITAHLGALGVRYPLRSPAPKLGNV